MLNALQFINEMVENPNCKVVGGVDKGLVSRLKESELLRPEYKALISEKFGGGLLSQV